MILFYRISCSLLTIALIPGIVINYKSTLDYIVSVLWLLGFIWILGYNSLVENFKKDQELEELRKFKKEKEE